MRLTASPPLAAAPAADPADRPVLRFVFRGRLQQAQGLSPTTTVLAWLREHQRATGTKEGCNEGDCGACTVIVAELDEDSQAAPALRYRAVNSCLMFLPALDGKALLTVEDLGGTHPAQRALLACHGSQCGFCTPGFVMSLAALDARCRDGDGDNEHADAAPTGSAPARAATTDAVLEALSGNLCRCTGYRPIIDAARQMDRWPAQPLVADAAALAAQLQALRAEPPLHLASADGQHWYGPRSVEALAALRLALPQARLVAGSTDIALWVNKQLRALPLLISTTGVAALRRIGPVSVDGQPWLRIGAAASLQAAWGALGRRWPTLAEMGQRFASRPVREAGTLGGNLANGSPIGDSAPVLLALDAQLLLRRGELQRRLPLAQFQLDYGRNALQDGEFIEAVDVPLADADHAAPPQLRAWKLSRRHDSDISALACGLWLCLDGDRIAQARIAFGGMAATVRRAPRTEDALLGQPWTEATLAAAQAALAHDYQPLSDLRGSAAYRQRSAAALLRRFWLETRPRHPLPPTQTRVWTDGALP